MTGDYRRDLHAGFATPEGAVFDLVARGTGLRPVAREQLARGYDNEVYRVATRQGLRCIVRIKRRGGVPFQSEAWALAQCRARGVPVPDVLALDWIAIDGQRHEAMVQTELFGVPFSDLRATLTGAEQARVLEQAGAVLRRIHHVPVGGFYRPNAAGGWDITTWEGIAALARRDRLAERAEILRAGFNDDDFARMEEALRQNETVFAGGQPVLCHGDYLPGHWLVDESLTLSGVIDFGEWQGGLPIHDFADLRFMEPALALAPFLRGYGDATFTTCDLLVYQVDLMMGYLAHYVRIGNAGEARFTAARLRAVLAELAYS